MTMRVFKRLVAGASVGALAVIAAIAVTAGPASAATSPTIQITTADGGATAKGWNLFPQVRLQACDTRPDGHHATAVLQQWNYESSFRYDVATVSAYGGNTTCETWQGYPGAGKFRVRAINMEGSTIIGIPAWSASMTIGLT